MPVIKSAVKKLKQAKVKAAHNLAVRVGFRELITKFRKNPTKKLFPKLTSAIDKAAKGDVIHKNKASRLKSRLSKLLPKK